MRYASKRTYSWSPGIAYTVGLMASDGCLQQNRRHLDLTSTDVEQLANFSKALGRDITISKKSSGSDKQAYRIQFSDVAYYDFLVSVGLTPLKSKTLAALTVPDDFYADFLRGLFDGDGTTYGYMDPRWRSSFMFYVAFCSASPIFLNYLRSANTRMIRGIGKGSIRHSTRALSLVYAKADSHKLFEYMYYGEDCISLTRKRYKLSTFVDKDKADIMLRN
jgi:hypothetical protein